MDGRLEEPAWASAAPIGPLVQREPVEGVAASEATDVRVLFTIDALYVGLRCRDGSAGRIVATQLGRDADLDVDDFVTVVVDPLFDRRGGYFFQVNPAGARTDGQIANNAESLSREWDGIWSAAARLTPEGWDAEIEIPFKTLRVDPATSVWGFNVERQIKRRQEIDRWAGARQNIWIGNLAEAGRLDGLAGLAAGLGLDLRPYASVVRAGDGGERAWGIDAFKTLGPGLTAALTVNTDFAETEVDQRQVNLTRFPLLYPEKRAFFLDGADVFDVAGLATSTELRPFFTRRVGLVGDVAVPVRAGAKIIGRQAGYDVGVLAIATGAATHEALPGGRLAGRPLLAARARRHLFEQSWVGAIVTRGTPVDPGAATLVGVDARLATSTFRGSRNLSLDLFGFATEARGGQDHAAGIKLDYPNDRWDVALAATEIGASFQPALGFVPRTGIRRTRLFAAFQPRPRRWGVRQFTFEASPSVTTTLRGQVVAWQFEATPLSALAESGDRIAASVAPEFERVDQPFVIARGVVLPPGDYRWTRAGASLNTATRRFWVVDAAWRRGGFYDGQRGEVDLGLTVKPSAHVALAVRVDRNDVTLPAGRFTTRLVTARADGGATPDVSWSALVQYDSESRLLGLQGRFRWILRAGNDLFVVVNRGWLRAEHGAYEAVVDRITAKFQYTFRF
ncbi:MAG: DUF5916 domain-containing protein [Vicinamibacterales bacterium]